jgi:OMF family outer membrane factor
MQNIKKNGIKTAITFAAILISTIAASAQKLSLEQCIDTALQYNRNVILSQLDINIADARSKELRGNLLPKLNGMADYRYYTNLPYQLMPAEAFGGPAGTYKEVQFGVPQSLNANLQIALPIYNSSAISAVKTSKLVTELLDIQKTKTNEEVVMEVSNAYYNAQILLHQLAFLDSNIINTDKLVKTTTLLHRQQLAKGTDVDRLRLQSEQIRSQRSTVFSQHQQALNALKFLMGKPLSDSIEVSKGEKSIIEKEFQLNTNTDIMLINKKIELNISELKTIRNSALPSLGAYGMYGTTGFGTTGSNSFFNLHPIGYVGAQLTIPIFNGRIIKHKISGKKIEIGKSTIQKELVSEKISLDLKNADIQYELAKRNIALVASQTELANKIYDNTVLQNEQGLVNITDILLADNALRESQHNYLVALINLRKAELEYKRVTGNLLPDKN